MTDPTMAVRAWLEQVVIGLDLCPFARQPLRDDRVRITVSDASDDATLLSDLHAELVRLGETDAHELETTLMIVPGTLTSFDDFNDFLALADALLGESGWEGVIQIASFHPAYRFAGTVSHAASNLTNRAPFPILHLLREESVATALSEFDRPERIYARNIETVEALDDEDKRRLFPYLGKL